MNHKKQEGFIAFVSLLVISAVTLAIAVSVSLLGIQEADTSFVFEKGLETLTIAQSCVEEGLLQLRDNAQFSQETLNVENGSCTIKVTGTSPSFIIVAQATLNGPPVYSKTIQAGVKRVGGSLSMTGWQELP